jgi:CHAD domain-containing protein
MKARRVKGLDPKAPLRTAAAQIVRVRLTELHSFAATALEPSAATAQHDMRIAAKRLRYVLEVTDGCFGAEAEAARRTARELQGVLGDIHDCDVMLPRVRHIDSLATLLRERRKLLFQRFRDLWQAERGKGTWTALERLLQEPA